MAKKSSTFSSKPRGNARRGRPSRRGQLSQRTQRELDFSESNLHDDRPDSLVDEDSDSADGEKEVSSDEESKNAFDKELLLSSN